MEYIFENEEYTIAKIHLNWRMEIKLPAKVPQYGIDRIFYASDELPIEHANDCAKSYIDEHFYRKGEKGYNKALKRDEKASAQVILNRG